MLRVSCQWVKLQIESRVEKAEKKCQRSAFYIKQQYAETEVNLCCNAQSESQSFIAFMI